jgi:hypothetical protein
MLAHAMLALLLPFAQAAEPTCRLLPPATTGCFSLPALKGREIHVPVNTTRLEPDALRLCSEESLAETVDLGIVLPASNRRTRGMDSAVRGVSTLLDTLRTRGGGDHVALTISRIGTIPPYPVLGPVATTPDPTAEWQTAVGLSTTAENLLVSPIALSRALLDGTRTTGASNGDGKLLVIFVHGMPADWDPYVRAGLEVTTAQDTRGNQYALLPLQVETHVVLVEDAEGIPTFPILENTTRARGATAHHLVAPTSADVDELLRDILAKRRDRRLDGVGTIGWEIHNTDLAVSSWSDPFLPVLLASTPLLDSALPLREGPNALEVRRTRRVGPFTLRDTTRLTVVTDLAPGTDSLATTTSDAAWICRASDLRIERTPTRDRPLLDVLLKTRATGLTVQEFQVQDSAQGGTARSFVEGGGPSLRWVGNLEAPLDQPGAPFSVSSRGDLVVARWNHPRDARDSARDSVRINPDRAGWVRFTESALSWPGGRLEATAWIPGGSADTLKAIVRCGKGPEKSVFLMRDGETWGTAFTVKAGPRPWGDTSLSCGDAGPADSLRVRIRMDGVTGDSVPLVDRPVATGSALCAVKMRPGSCFDPALLEDHGWLVPKNTTHLDLGSMSLCMPSRKVPAPARISWVMDNSGSMQQNDPGNIRFGTISRGIQRQRLLNPSSEAGFVRFESSIQKIVPVAPLDPVQTNALMQATTQVQFGGGTNWEIALRAALNTFDSSRGTGPAAIVMISDGLPNEGVWTNALRPGMPPVYVIYIGNPGEVSGRPEMQTLIRRTGGRLWTLGTAPQQALMDAAVAEIMGLFETEQPPLRATITSSPMRQNARIPSFQKTIGGAYVGQADSLLAIIDGGNSFDLQLTTQSPGFPSSVRSYPFSLSVGLPATPASFDLAGSPFRISCSDPGSLRFVDSLGRGIDWQPTSERRVALELSPHLHSPATKPASARSEAGFAAAVAMTDRRTDDQGATRITGRAALTTTRDEISLVIDTLGDTVRATWCHERVPRDCASGSLALVRVAAAPTVHFVDDSVEGPRGSVMLEVQADALERDTLPVEVSGKSGERLTVLVTRDPDGVHRALVAFTQVPGEGGADTLSLERPKAGIPTWIRARVVTGPDSAAATVILERRRDTLVLEPGSDPGTVQVRLLTPDGSAGGRLVVLAGPAGTDSVTLGDDGTAVRPLRTLVGEALDPSRILAVAVDTLYGDTLRDTTLVEPLPSSRIRFADPLPSGSTGRLWLEARVPSSRQVVRASLAWPQGDIEVYLTRDADGLYRTSLPFARGTGGSTDTLRLPALRSVELTVTIPPSSTWRGSSDAIVLAAPTAAWNVVVKDSGRIEVLSDRVDGSSATIRSRSDATDRTHTTVPSGSRDSASIATWTFLEESLDSARVEILRIDPVFGDTSRQTVVVPSPWFASRLDASPDTLNPRVGDSTLLEVRDRDLHPERQDTARVTDATGRTWVLLETSPTSGVFRTRVASRDLAPDWASRPYQAPWTVDLTYADLAHPGDTSRVSVVLVKVRPAPESTTVALTVTDTAAASGLLRLEVVSPTGTDTLLAEITWQDRRDTVTMVRTSEGTFLSTVPYTRWTGSASDTLRLVGPRDLLVTARVLPDTSRAGSSDSLLLRSPRGDLELERRNSSQWSLSVTKVAGPASSLVVRSGSSTTTLPMHRDQDRDTLLVDLHALLPESTDSVGVEFLRVDPVFGDTARRTVRVASPWFPSSLSVSPDSADPLRAGSVRLRVTDRDRDGGRIDSVRVRSSTGETWMLRETDARSGVYEEQIPVRELAPDWASHPNHETWTVALEHVDPDHVADTSRAVLTLRKSPPPPETTSVRMRFHDEDAASGHVTLEVDSPTGHDTAWVVLQGDGTGPDTLRLVRDRADGTLRLVRPYTRWTGSDSDTLRWAAQRRLVVRALLLPDSSRLASRDSAILGSTTPVLVLKPADSVHWTATIGPVEGPASNLRVRLGESSWTLGMVRTGNGDSTRFDPSSFLPESPDSVDLVVEHIDPVYGDTTRQTLRVASPWFQGVLTAQPDTVDAASGTTVVVTLRDRDPNPDRIDTALVVDQDGKEWRLVETSASSGRFKLRVRSWTLDPQWASRSPGTIHTVRLTRIDPDHPRDTARTEIAIVRGSTGLNVSTRGPLVPIAERGSSDPALRLIDLASGTDAQQGLVLQTWVPVVAEVFVYDLQGTWVTSGSFRIEPDPSSGRGAFLISWNGTDHRGVPVGHGPYPTRVMVRTKENVLLLNQVLVLGRKELGDSGR